MKAKVLFTIFAVMLLSAVSALAADISGKWQATRETQNGTMNTDFNFKQSGTALTGTMSGFQGNEMEIKDGKVEGDTVTFSTSFEGPNGAIEMKYTGKIAGDEITFTREGGFGGRGGGGKGGGRAPQPIVAKKVK